MDLSGIERTYNLRKQQTRFNEPFERFSLNFTQMFLSMSSCAESMTQLCQLKVKVTLQGHWILQGGGGRGYDCPSDCCLVIIVSWFPGW